MARAVSNEHQALIGVATPMSIFTVVALAFSGALAGVPVAAIAYSVPESGPVRLPKRWWAGEPAPHRLLITTAAITGGAGAAVGFAVADPLVRVALWIFVLVGVGLAIVDVRRRRLPHLLTGILWVTSALCLTSAAITGHNVAPLERAVLAAATSTAIMLVVAFVFPGQLGLGDVAFAGAIALTLGWLSWQAAVSGLFFGYFLQAAALPAARRRHANSSTPTQMPLGPALLAGWFLAVVLVRIVQ